MNVRIETRDSFHLREIERLRVSLVALLEGRTTPDEQQLLLCLADNLLTYSHSHVLLKRAPETILDWLLAIRDFLARRKTLVNLDWFRPDGREADYLLINTPDVPFLVDSLQIMFQRLQVQAIIISHPILSVRRDHGVLRELAHAEGESVRESFMLVQVERGLNDPASFGDEVLKTIELVQKAGEERSRFSEQLEQIKGAVVDASHVDFFDWLMNGNFLCFGSSTVDVAHAGGVCRATFCEGPFGWFPERVLVDGDGSVAAAINQNQRSRLERDQDLLVELTDQVSLIYRAEPLVYIGYRVKQNDGRFREHAFVGLFTQKSINEQACEVPVLKSRIMAALKRQHVLADSYDFRKVQEIFNTFPKVELFFLDNSDMDLLVRSLVSLQRYKSVKVVFTRSLSLSGVTLLMIMPREFYSSTTVRRLETYLRRYFNARQIDSRVINFFSDYLSLHVRLLPRNKRFKFDIDRLEKMLTCLARPWSERLRSLLLRKYDPETARLLWQRYVDGFSREYQAMVHPRFAIRDMRAMERLLDGGQELFDLWGPFHGRRESFILQFYSLGESCLNELMPFLENLSLTVVEEVDFNIEIGDQTVFIKSFSIRNDHPQARPLAPQREHLLEILQGLRQGRVEDDYLNRLLVLTGFDWKQIDIFRAYRNYYFQLGNPFTKRRAAFALINNPPVVDLLYRYFEARFRPDPRWNDPLVREEEALMPVRMDLARALEDVSDINEDRILRSLFNLIDSTIRTNFFLRRDRDDYFLSFKISAIGIIDMPFPRPMYETYVHSTTMEGIHLRGDRIARGGIRWSDRPDDFRTEVLGLMKTQMTKNALIVPVGSKGGFVVKTPFATREEGAELSRQAYITLMRGLLDLVDNRVAGSISRPNGIVVFDDPDPYLVVAADKGTAHLPDTANAVSHDYNFWLGDAFASGGSAGYDHKKLGITARGAWECVKRHFRELGKDIQNEDFTVVGIGDMGGDVFGNGMLLSKQIRLLAAFNHQHIFLDPNPDSGRSWEERKRLFDLPRSSWNDYDRSLISKGGGVWPRGAKEIPLSAEVRAWLGVRHGSMEGDELIRRLLCAEVELLWNGGIGTYAKASSEKNTEVGDRANDNVRVNAGQLKAKVVGEGGNLGMTQRARIEYALAGGRLNTDSIDNSAGVDTSDHEVNLKIFFQTLRDLKILKTDRSRNRLLKDIEDEVCERVLFDNYSQSLCLSLDQLRCQKDPEPFIDLADRLSNAGLLDRQGEFLPSRKELTARGQSYTRPELAVLLSYSKMHLYQTLLDSPLPDRQPAQVFLGNYFPALVSQRYSKHLHQHPLRREIIATMMTNRIIDQAGCSWLNSLTSQTGAIMTQGVAAYLLFDQILGGQQMREQIYAADNRMTAERQYLLLLSLENALADFCVQVVEQDHPLSLDHHCVERYRERLILFKTHLSDLLSAEQWRACQMESAQLLDEGFAEEQASLLASLSCLDGFLPAVHLAERSGGDMIEVSAVISHLGQRLNLTLLNARLDQYVSHDRWDRMAVSSLRSSLARQFVRLCSAVVASRSSVANYLGERRSQYDRYIALSESIKASPPSTISPFMVLLHMLEGLADG
ncbi:MAG: NAD-glutamate dehydrogenase [Desulfuromonas sp.]|nr:MAG: NAD-glutamate dehydrogenase [Desulfuromonas sp.]